MGIFDNATINAAGKAQGAKPRQGNTAGRSGLEKSFASIGICCPLAWAFLINAAGSDKVDLQASWQASYLVLAVAMVVLGLLARKKPAIMQSQTAGYLITTLGAASSLLLVLSYASSVAAWAQLPSTVVCSCVLGWLYLQWGAFYTRIGLKSAIGCLFVGNIAASTVKCIAHFSPLPVLCIISMLLPVASNILCRMALIDSQAQPRAALLFDAQSLKGLWKVALAVVALSFVTALLVGMSFGNQSAAPADVFLLGRLFEVLVSGVVLALVLGARKSFNYAQLWRILLVVLAVDVLSQVLLPQLSAIRCVESSAWNLLVLFVWLTATDVARHSKATSELVIGISWALYTASFSLGSMLASWVNLCERDMAVAVSLMFVLALVGTFCLEVRDQDTKWIFAELSGEPVKPPEDHYNIDERCDEVGAARGLSPRELEVMKMLCKGRTKSYIAETLYLTENTVRTHTKHIYTKLDVHSKQELMTLVGV